MTHETLARWARAVALATAATALLLAVVVIAAEEVPALKDWLKATFYHHWLGKGALSLLVFASATLVFRYRRDNFQLSTIIVVETLAVVLAATAIAGFFLLHTMKLV